jgi:lantibiotic biosynthesis protein
MSSDETFLAAADSIGQGIVADAVWHDGRCSWIGAVVDREQPWRSVYRALEANVYDGTAGVGLFLAHLAGVTGDQDVHRTAVGALRHALERAPDLPPPRRDGFHAGSLGIAWAAARVATLLDEEELCARARAVPRSPSTGDRCPDVILGSAGSILAMLALSDELERPALVEDAVASGEDLIGCATITDQGWSWATPDRRHRRHLCGLSHGAAGIGWALLELYAATGEERFRLGATGAFAYERSWLDERTGTWPDLRISGQRRDQARRIASPAVGTWCHGEGGIALTRLRAVEVLGSEACARDADLALEATRRHVAGTLPYEIDHLTLCHGAAGSADVLVCAEAALGGRWRDAAGLAAQLGRVALERHDTTGTEWPCAAAGAKTPGLFLGLSGIGWWLLRLYDHGIPSPLLMPIVVDSGTGGGVGSARRSARTRN